MSHTVLVLGGEENGIYASKLLLMKGYEVVMYEENTKYDHSRLRYEINYDEKFKLILGEYDINVIENIEMAVLSNNFPKYSKIIKSLNEYDKPIISELELGYIMSKGNVCAIAGSNGKTTTASIITSILKKHYEDVHEAGFNNKIYTREALLTSDKSCTVAECDCFQLEDIKTFKPNVAAILNVTPEYLNRYNTYEDYIKAIINIARNMTKSDILILNYEDDVLRELAYKKDLFKSKIFFFSSKRVLAEGVYLKDNFIYLKDKTRNIKLFDVNDTKLLGTHNFENIMAAIATTYFMDVSIEDMVEAIKDFMPIKDRLEYVREKGGVIFYNDSKSDNPGAAIKGIEAMNRKTILIAGGQAKNTDFGAFCDTIKSKVRHLILIGSAKKVIAAKARMINYNSISFANDIDEAVELANNFANIGEAVLFSPGCECYDMYESPEERGEKFKDAVYKLR